MRPLVSSTAPPAGTTWHPGPPPLLGRARVGLLGGSFNPAHEGHLHISRLALDALRLDEVWWLVAPQNPLKPARGMAPLADRVEGAAAVAGEDRRIRVTDIEAALHAAYTVETQIALRHEFPRLRFVWIMGADNLVQLPLWKDWQRIFKAMPIAVFARAPYSLRALAGAAARRYARARLPEAAAAALADFAPPAWVFLNTRLHPASATAIRAGERHGAGRSSAARTAPSGGHRPGTVPGKT